MCGIAGLFDPSLPDAEAAHLVARMLAQIHYRGPDGFGLARGNGCSFGTARLAIVDIAGGNQPMATNDGRYRIALNGEIFNHVELRKTLEQCGHSFHSRSDTEVLLHALVEWDIDALARLEGQFAFAFFDTHQRRLILGRDRFGERPLYYYKRDKWLAFASEIKSLFSLPGMVRALDPAAIARLSILWVSLPDETVFVGIKALPPGHWAEVTSAGMTVHPWAHPTVPGSPFVGDIETARREVRRNLEDSVQRRLRSDVEVGCYLSGGLDSSIITRVAHDMVGLSLRTFSVTFADPVFDEAVWQHKVANHLGTEHTTIHIGPGDIAAVFPEVVRHCETPLFRAAPAPMYLLAQAVRQAGIKVVLTGEGADEAFLGYPLFKEALFRRDFANFADDESRLASVKQLHPYLSHFNDDRVAALLGFYGQHLTEATPGLFSHEPRFSLGRFALRCMRPEVQLNVDAMEQLSSQMNILHPGFNEAGCLVKAQALEYVTLLGGYLLSSQGDRMTSAHGIEARYPFLDHNLVELALSLPVGMRLHNGTEKAILRDAFGDALPPDVSARPKNPYRSPDAAAFLHEPRAEWLDDILSAGNLSHNQIFDPKIVASLISKLAGQSGNSISPREDQAFILIISTLLIEQMFVDNFVAVDVSVVERNLSVSLID